MDDAPSAELRCVNGLCVEKQQEEVKESCGEASIAELREAFLPWDSRNGQKKSQDEDEIEVDVRDPELSNEPPPWGKIEARKVRTVEVLGMRKELSHMAALGEAEEMAG